MYIPSRWLYATGKDMLHPGSERNDGRIHGNRSSDCGACSGGCNSIRRMFTVLPQLLYERSYAVAVILIILLHWGMMSAISTFVRLTWVWADFASVAEFDLAVSFDLETGVLWFWSIFAFYAFLISAKEMFAVFTAETEARAPSVFAGILSWRGLTILHCLGYPGGTCEIVHMAGCFFCDWIENVVTGAGKQEGHQWSCSHDFQIQILFTKNWLAAAFDRSKMEGDWRIKRLNQLSLLFLQVFPDSLISVVLHSWELLREFRDNSDCWFPLPEILRQVFPAAAMNSVEIRQLKILPIVFPS